MARIIQDSDDEADAVTPVVTLVRQPQMQMSTDDSYQSKMARFNEYFDGKRVESELYGDGLDLTAKRRKLSHSSDRDGDGDTIDQAEAAIKPRELPEALLNPPPMATGSDLISTLPDNTYQQMQIVAQAEAVANPFDFPSDAFSQGRGAKISSETKSSSLPWTQIRAFENENATEDRSQQGQSLTLDNILAIDVLENDVENIVQDEIQDRLQEGGNDATTFTPPGTPVKTDASHTKKSSRKSKLGKKLKKRKKTTADEGELPEDDLAMVDTTFAIEEEVVESFHTPIEKSQDDNPTKAQATRSSKAHKSPAVSVVIPVSNTKLSTSEEHRIASAAKDDVEVEDTTKEEILGIESPAVEPTTPLKRGRGRPKKSTVKDLVKSLDNIGSVSTDPKQKITTANEREGTEDESADIKTVKENVAITVQTSIVTTDNKENNAPAGSTSSKGASKSTTLSTNGKTVHRVGLSRRVRIAPLLRSVRK